MDINQAFPSKFIKAADLQGQDVTVSIARFAMESVDDDAGELKPVIYFAGHQRGLVLNKTNALAIADLYGTETDAWLNQPVTLFPTQCNYAAKMVDCIRIRPFPPQHANAQQPPPFVPPQPPPVPAAATFEPQPQPFVPPAASPPAPMTAVEGQQLQPAGQSPVQF